MEPHEKKLLEYAHFAAHLAREAGKVTLKYYRSMLQIERKSDQSPVTVADRETERYLVETIRSVYPEHGILGEELGEVNAGAPWRWVLDPIDGTQAFIHGVPLYTVLVALMHENEPLIGVIYNPPQDELVAAAKGLGCNYNGQPCHVSHVDHLSRARVHTTDWSSLAAHRPRFTRALLDTIRFGRTWADGYGYMLVATGRADAMLDPVLNPWDIAPLIPIITEAGGRFTTLEGAPADDGGLADNGIASNGLIHDQILELSGIDTVHPVEE